MYVCILTSGCTRQTRQHWQNVLKNHYLHVDLCLCGIYILWEALALRVTHKYMLYVYY